MYSHKKIHLPPKHAPKDSAQMSGCNGRFSDCNDTVIRTIIVVSGMLSTKAEASADTHRMIKIATANRHSSLTVKIIFFAWVPMKWMRPSFASDSISTNKTAKNNKVDHSTRSRADSRFRRSYRISNRMTPRRVIQPSDNRWIYGSEWRKKQPRTNVNATIDLMSNGNSRIGYYKRD